MTFRLLGILGVTVMIISGCAQSKTIENIGIMNVYGVDEAEDGQLDTTTTFYKFGSRNKSISSLVTGQGKTLMEGQKQMNYKLDFRLDPGAIQLELFGKNAAENGLIEYLQHASRHPKAANDRLLGVSATTAKKLMTQVKKLPDVEANLTLPDMIDVNNKQGVLPRITLHDFQRMYYEPGVDPVLPVLSYQNKTPKLDALALFKGGKLAGQIPVDRAFYINVLQQNVHGLKQEVPVPLQPLKTYLREEPEDDQEKLYTLFNVKNGTSKTKLVDKQNLDFHTQLNFDVELLELTKNVDLQEQEAIDTLEQEIEKAIKKQYEQLVMKLQKRNVDPMGYGQVYKTKKRQGILTESEWRDKFPDITVDVGVDVEIINQGMTP